MVAPTRAATAAWTVPIDANSVGNHSVALELQLCGKVRDLSFKLADLNVELANFRIQVVYLRDELTVVASELVVECL